MNDSVILEDEIEERSRTIYLDIEYQPFKDRLLSTEAYVQHTKYGEKHNCVLLCTDEFLQSVDVITSLHPDAERSFEDYFSSPGSKDESKETVTAVVLHPYIEHKELAKKTGRDYIEEMDKCMNFIKSI